MWINKKMMVIFYLLLTVTMGGCTNDHNFVTKTVGAGQNVTLSCICNSSRLYQDRLFWIRLVSGNHPEFLGGTFTVDYNGINNTSHITVKQEPGTFVMQISKTKPSDTGLYYCVKVRDRTMTFLEGMFLTIKGPELDVIQVHSSDRIHSGDQETLQCSVFSKFETKTCPENHSVYWFRAGTDKSHSSLFYVHGNSGDECGRSPEAPSKRKCVYSLSKDVSSSHPGSFYCAVATCGHMIFGNETKLDIKAPDVWDLQTANTVLFLLCAALVTSLMVIGSLIYTIKKKTCDCCNGSGGGQQGQQTEEGLMVYTVPTFTRRKNGKVERRNEKATGEGETVYNDVLYMYSRGQRF